MSRYNTRRIDNEIKTFLQTDSQSKDDNIASLDSNLASLDDDPYRYLEKINTNYYFIILPKSIYINNEILVTMNFDNSNYPFRPPKQILIRGIDYMKLLTSNNIIQEFLDKFTTITCLCCSTLMCRDNWNPHKTIRDILDEIVKIISIRKRMVEHIFAKNITEKYFGFYLPIVEFI